MKPRHKLNDMWYNDKILNHDPSTNLVEIDVGFNLTQSFSDNFLENKKNNGTLIENLKENFTELTNFTLEFLPHLCKQNESI